jgi:hypothetical protein
MLSLLKDVRWGFQMFLIVLVLWRQDIRKEKNAMPENKKNERKEPQVRPPSCKTLSLSVKYHLVVVVGGDAL